MSTLQVACASTQHVGLCIDCSVHQRCVSAPCRLCVLLAVSTPVFRLCVLLLFVFPSVSAVTVDSVLRLCVSALAASLPLASPRRRSATEFFQHLAPVCCLCACHPCVSPPPPTPPHPGPRALSPPPLTRCSLRASASLVAPCGPSGRSTVLRQATALRDTRRVEGWHVSRASLARQPSTAHASASGKLGAPPLRPLAFALMG